MSEQLAREDSKDYTEVGSVKIARKKTTIEKETEKRLSAAHDFVSHLPKTCMRFLILYQIVFP